MKKYLLLTISLKILSIFFSSIVYADAHCLDDTFHFNEYCARRYTPVCCTCPCWRYKHAITDRNRCIQCLHFRDPQGMRSF